MDDCPKNCDGCEIADSCYTYGAFLPDEETADEWDGDFEAYLQGGKFWDEQPADIVEEDDDLLEY